MPTITTVPAPANPPVSSQQSASQMSARDRAIQALIGNSSNQQASPVSNPTSVSPEEMTAISPPKFEASPAESGQERSVEGSEETPPQEATKAKEEPLSAQYAQLARKEKALRAEMQKLKAEREAFRRDQETAKAKDTTPHVDQSQFVPKERLTKETLAVLSELGISYDQLTQMALNAPSPETQAFQAHIAKLESKITELEQKTANTQKTFEDRDQENYQQAVSEIRRGVRQIVNTNADFETIKASGQHGVDEVVKLIETTFREGLDEDHPKGTLLSEEEACRMVEEELLEEVIKYAKLNKIQQRMKAAAPTQAPATPKQETKQTPKTLTNTISTPRQLSAKERAILAFKGELPKS